jgi:molecular chaperone GrpE
MSEEQKQSTENKSQLESLNCALEEEKKHSEELLTRLKYMQADLENLKKRMDREQEDLKKYCNERIIIELLEIMDELEMAVKSRHGSESSEAMTQGVRMILKKLGKLLEKEGVSPIECLGKPFDPSKHNAVSTTEKEDVDGCVIIEELRKGYTLNDKVIRPSTVKVAVRPSSNLHKKETDQNE